MDSFMYSGFHEVELGNKMLTAGYLWKAQNALENFVINVIGSCF